MSHRFHRSAALIGLALLPVLSACSGYMKIVERGKYAEAVGWLMALRKAEELHLLKIGLYESSLDAMKDELPPLTLFTPGRLRAEFDARKHEATWSVELVRGGPGKRPCSPIYGCYTLTYSVSTRRQPILLCSTAACARDLLLQKTKEAPAGAGASSSSNLH